MNTSLRNSSVCVGPVGHNCPRLHVCVCVLLHGMCVHCPLCFCPHPARPRKHLSHAVWPQLTPVAKLEPVEVGGVTIQHVSLHNAGHLREMALAPGDVVAVARAGDVIPQVCLCVWVCGC